MAARVMLSPRFIADLQAELTNIAGDSPHAARLVEGRVRRAMALLPDFPEIGRPGRVSGTRELIVPKTTLIVAYRVNGDEVQVLAIRPARKRWPKRF